MIFARLFKFLVLPGQDEAYAAYLRDVVTPIDEVAHKAGVFDRLHTIVPEGETCWNHGRIFIFRDRAQRDAFAVRIAEHTAVFDGDAGATANRKSFAESLRRLVGMSDFQIS